MFSQLVSMLWVFIMVVTIPLKFVFGAWYVIVMILYGDEEDSS